MINDLEVLLNEFARRSFRDEADRDYIAARIAYRGGLLSQALWSSLQAMEKYLKYILLVNRVLKPKEKKDQLGHDIVKARNLIASETPFAVDFVDADCEKYFDLVNEMGPNRYLEMSQFSRRDHLQLLDRTIWSIRRYCTVLNTTAPDGKNLLQLNLQGVAKAAGHPHHKHRLSGGGELEKILRSKNDFLKEALLWQNGEYADPATLSPWREYRTSFTNSPLYMHPEIVDEVMKYVYFPEKLAKLYRQHAKDIASGKTPQP